MASTAAAMSGGMAVIITSTSFLSVPLLLFVGFVVIILDETSALSCRFGFSVLKNVHHKDAL